MVAGAAGDRTLTRYRPAVRSHRTWLWAENVPFAGSGTEQVYGHGHARRV